MRLLRLVLRRYTVETPSILNGKVMLIDSGSGTTPPIGIEASTHSCVGIVDAGIIDLSIRFTRSANPSREVSWPVNGVLHSRATPPGTCNVKVTTKTSDYERAVAEATHRVATRSLIYHLSGGFELTIKNLEHSFDVTNSPLSDRLRDELRLGSDVYAKAALYLWDFLNGISPPLSTLPQDAAWLAIGARTGNALWRFASRTALRSHGATQPGLGVNLPPDFQNIRVRTHGRGDLFQFLISLLPVAGAKPPYGRIGVHQVWRFQ